MDVIAEVCVAGTPKKGLKSWHPHSSPAMPITQASSQDRRDGVTFAKPTSCLVERVCQPQDDLRVRKIVSNLTSR